MNLTSEQQQFYDSLTPEQQEQWKKLQSVKNTSTWGIIESQNKLSALVSSELHLLLLVTLSYKLSNYTDSLAEGLTKCLQVIEDNWDNLPTTNKGLYRSVGANIAQLAKAPNKIKKEPTKKKSITSTPVIEEVALFEEDILS